jgi:5-methyltetrahydropteroyltriglutamate--homocysteine methyltransferase
MRRSEHHVLTSHVGSLPRPDALIEANCAREAGEAPDATAFEQILKPTVSDVVQHQRDLGIDIPNDGEFGKSVTYRVHYGAWWNYAFQRWGGLEFGAPGPYGRTPQRSRPGEIC